MVSFLKRAMLWGAEAILPEGYRIVLREADETETAVPSPLVRVCDLFDEALAPSKVDRGELLRRNTEDQ